jgi:purine-binding chemotaxis protein CheW
MTETAHSTAQQVLCFALAGEDYGIPILKVREIQCLTALTRIPRSPDWMPGVINLRGAIVPIVELRTRFRLGAAPEGIRPVIVIVELAGRILGMRVDAVSDVVSLEPGQLRPVPDCGAEGGIGREFISALAPLEDGAGGETMLILLDLERLLSSQELDRLDVAP